MKVKIIWITIAAIATISQKSFSGAQFQSVSESKLKGQTNDSINTTALYEGVENHLQQFKNILENGTSYFLPFSNINKNCTKYGKQYMLHLINQIQWAPKMFDSSEKFPRDILSDYSDNMGNFDQCLSVSSKQFDVYDAYALASVQFRPSANRSDNTNSIVTEPKKILWALCFPDSCSAKDVETFAEIALISAFKSYNIVVNVTIHPSMYTTRDSTLERTNGILLMYGIFILAITMALIGTLYELFAARVKSDDESSHRKFLCSFSIITNIRKITGETKNEEFVSANILKTVGIVTVMIGHRVVLDLGTPSFNPEYTKRIFTDFWLAFFKTPVAVEIFFVLSAFFTYIVIEERLRTSKPLNFVHVLTYRLARIFPTYLTVILMFGFILPYMGNGPLWKAIVHPEAEFCRKNWWTNMLFINNYVNTYEMCMVHAWYLACDMHFFIVGVVLTYIVWRWKRAGLGIFGVLFVMSIYIPAKYIYDHKQWGVMPHFPSNINNLRTTEHFQKIYIKSHHRITTYLIGLAAAYIYLYIKRSKFKLSTKSKTIGFITCFLLHNACYIATGFLYLPDLQYNPWYHLLYFTFQRIIYSLVISYVLVVSSLSSYGLAGSFMKFKLFTIIARLTYVLYLTHFIIQLQSIGQIRQPQYGNFWTLFWKINADFTTAFWCALPINLIIETPSREILNKIMNFLLKIKNNESDSKIKMKKCTLSTISINQ